MDCDNSRKPTLKVSKTPGSKLSTRIWAPATSFSENPSAAIAGYIEGNAALAEVYVLKRAACLGAIGSRACGKGARRRAGSPKVGDSTLITSAPWSARSRVENGPATPWDRSMTRIPSRGSIEGLSFGLGSGPYCSMRVRNGLIDGGCGGQYDSSWQFRD